ncbi:hypothetical protein [Zophobihabitans entericus]|uniref:Uncharacterized protein n=1 Tax=Zophobihabitans entericus TaxID=1635327 RepID=A0A6G9ID28_9GAMM|nr:hypothetical protein [Zophobihabitans entericus]QIQ22135.1 hypothetical protein IPMB12_10840 [Zophobihabitans entericus]
MIEIAGRKFLLPDTHNDYPFPQYIIEHKERIEELIQVNNKILKLMGKPFSAEMEVEANKAKLLKHQLSVFIDKTAIIGFPFDSRDAELYAIDRKVNIALKFSI